MTKEELLKQEILSQYKSVRQFAMELGIPCSTLSSALDGKLDGMAYGTVLKICDKLNLNPINLTEEDTTSHSGLTVIENKMLGSFRQLNKAGKLRFLEYLTEMALLDKYTKD